ncbi:MFS transporter [Pseudomonas neuropathica]|uniref:MFS transporter n=1 Tax=Pseudomonas neuropathica TaxID=2730425 RepID=UPI003EB8C322
MNLPKVKGYWCLCGVRFSTSIALWIDFILIFSVLTFGFHSSTEKIGLAAAMYGIPPLILGPVFGRMIDKVNLFRFIPISFTLRCAASCLLFVASTEDIFLLLVFFKGLSNLGSAASEIVLTRKLLDDSDIPKNTAFITVVDQFIKVCSPLVAGVVASLSDKSSGFLFSALFSLAGLIFSIALWRLHGKTLKTHTATERTLGSLAAIRKLYASGPSTQLFLLCSLAQSGVLGFYDSMLGTLLKTLSLGPSAFGIVVSATALGGVSAGFAFKYLYPSKALLCSTISLMIYGVCIMFSGVVAILQLPFALILFIAVFFLSGIAYSLTSMAFAVTLQKSCSPSHLGFISSSARSLTLTLLIGGPVIGGFVGRITSIETVFMIAGLSAIVIGLALHLKYAQAVIDRTLEA